MTSPNLLERLANSSLGRKWKEQVEREEADALESERQQHGAAIARLERERETELAGLQKVADKATKERSALETKLAAASAAERDAVMAKRSVAAAYDAQISKEQNALAAIADPRIDEEIAKVRQWTGQLRIGGYETVTERRWFGIAERLVLTGSNFAAVNRRMESAIAAARALEELRATYVASGDVEAAIERIVATFGGYELHTPIENFAEPRPITVAA